MCYCSEICPSKMKKLIFALSQNTAIVVLISSKVRLVHAYSYTCDADIPWTNFINFMSDVIYVTPSFHIYQIHLNPSTTIAVETNVFNKIVLLPNHFRVQKWLISYLILIFHETIEQSTL